MATGWRTGALTNMIIFTAIAVVVGVTVITSFESFTSSAPFLSQPSTQDNTQETAGKEKEEKTQSDNQLLSIRAAAESEDPSYAGKSEGEQCDAFYECEGLLTCTETTDTFTNYETACCPALQHWNGYGCIKTDDTGAPDDSDDRKEDGGDDESWDAGAGTECRTTNECERINALLSCRETTDSVLLKDKACCPPPGHWDGDQCVYRKGTACFTEDQCKDGLACQPHHPDATGTEEKYCCPPNTGWDGTQCKKRTGTGDDEASGGGSEENDTTGDKGESDADDRPIGTERGESCEGTFVCNSPSLICMLTTPDYDKYDWACCPKGTHWNGQECVNNILGKSDDKSDAAGGDGPDDTPGDGSDDTTDSDRDSKEDNGEKSTTVGAACTNDRECEVTNTQLSCTTTTEDFTQYEKACCQQGHWNGERCVAKKGEPCATNGCKDNLNCARPYAEVDNSQKRCCPQGTRWDGSACVSKGNPYVVALVPVMYEEGAQQTWQRHMEQATSYQKGRLPFRENHRALRIVKSDSVCDVANAANKEFRPRDQQKFEQSVKECGDTAAKAAGHPQGADFSGAFINACLNGIDSAEENPCEGVTGYTNLQGFFALGSDGVRRGQTVAHEIGHDFRLCEGYSWLGRLKSKTAQGGRCGTDRIQQKYPNGRSATEDARCTKDLGRCNGRLLTGDPINPIPGGRDIMGPAGLTAERQFACDSYLAFQDVAANVYNYPIPAPTEEEIKECKSHIAGDITE